MAWHYNFTAPDGFRRVCDLPAEISTSRVLNRSLKNYYVLVIHNRVQTLGDILCSRGVDCVVSGGCVSKLAGYCSVDSTEYDSPVFWFAPPCATTVNELGAIVVVAKNRIAIAQYLSVRLTKDYDHSQRIC